VTYKRWDIVRLTFPYLEGHDAKKRPALIVSADGLAASCLGPPVAASSWAAMIATAKGGTLSEDIPVTGPQEAGLPEDCVIRPSRLFTIADDLVDRRLGTLKPRDRNAVAAFLKKHLP
jgi:mRNA-degrading endonuclease toxin of MazEF toxin-antitoxin module